MLMPLSTLGIKPKGILHLGACTGEEADYYDAVQPNIVVWFDCNPRTHDQLIQNVGHRNNHHVIYKAVTNVDDVDLDFHITNNNASSSVLPLKDHLKIYPDITEVDTIKVRGTTVDTALKDNNFEPYQFDFANLDLQGYELKALLGMTNVIFYLKWIYTEVNFQELYAGCCTMKDIESFLAVHGFKLIRIADTKLGWADAYFAR